MDTARVLVVDDDRKIGELITVDLEAEGYTVDRAGSAAEAIDRLRNNAEYNLVLLDVRLPDALGVDVLRDIHAIDQSIPVIMISAYATVDLAVQAVKKGAYDFLPKPFELEEMRIRVRNAIASNALSREVRALRLQIGERYSFENIVGKSDKMRRLYQLLQDVAVSDSTVLITGESGTGKELVAHAIHLNSPRATKPFIVINSAAIPETLLESELFGHEKGSFTGALARKIGKFEAANGGSVFLDEIGDLTPALQVKLLRVLQEREFERVGGLERIRVNVRIISATNKDLQTEVSAKRFREDLFYRLNVLPIELPPLRDRRDDIPLLTMHFLDRYAAVMNKKVSGISGEAMDMLTRYSWPGNVRELENAIERAVVMGKGERLEPVDFPFQAETPAPSEEKSAAVEQTPPAPTAKRKSSVSQIERDTVVAALRRAEGNITKAAKELGVGRDTMYRKMRKYRISRRNGA